MKANIRDFVHLHVHTQYSLLDGAIRINDLLKRVNDFGMDSVAITDHGTMFGVVEFYEKAHKAGIKPVIGCEFYVAPRSLHDKTSIDAKGLNHLILLAENNEGYRNLCVLASIAQVEGFYYKPRIDKTVLKEYSRGLIGLSACLNGEIPKLIKENKIDKADEAARFFLDIFGEENFFLEIQNNGIVEQEQINQALYEMSKRLAIPLVATNDCHYLDKEDVRAHDLLLCIQTGKTINDSNRLRFRTDQLYFKSKDEMCAYFKDYPDALENTVNIANRCKVEFDFNTYSVINKMGFAGYFLIVADFIQYAKENKIPVGPGRGSAAGSLVAYSLGITELDPIEHGLIFERFLNPARISMPDIDVDFCINGREKVYKYVLDRYGGGAQNVNSIVSQIITFGKLKPRAVIRDVGRALDIPLREIDAIAKMVPDVLNISLDNALKQEPKLVALAEEKPEVADLIKICRVLEGLPRHASTHPAGVVISDRPLVDYLPLYKGKKGEIVTQFDMKCVEKIGLVKFDFLGLRNLTVIQSTLELISEQNRMPPDLSTLDLNDSETYRLLASGDTTGVFQLESSGMKDLLVRLKPASFDDIIALVALYRPGPMESGMIDDYVERRHGRKTVEYLVPELEPILKETYGVIVYQEQVMKIAGRLANYTMAEADGLRKAMGKKNVKIMAEHRQRFMNGASENGISEDKAKKIFDLMEKFGGYGFNKSHSAAYGLIAYQTAFLKAHFPVEFMAALLTSEMHSSDGVVKYISECRSHGISVLSPDINESSRQFTINDKAIRFGLVAVKNVGEAAIEAIIKERKEGHFTSLFDFSKRVDLKKVNKRVVESLIKCGAFDAAGDFRSRMTAVLEDVLDVSGHPLNRYEKLLEKFADSDAILIKDRKDGKIARIGGIIRHKKIIKTKKNDLMSFVELEDMYGSVEIIIFPSVYAAVSELLVEDKPLFVQGKVQRDETSVKILADQVIPMDKAEEIWTTDIHFNLDINKIEKATLIKLNQILTKHQGSCRAYLHLYDPENTETIIAVSDNLRLKASPLLFSEVNRLVGYDAVETVCVSAEESAQYNGGENSKQKGKFKYA